jgi:diacylglycerol O-acyltransferase
VTAPVRMSNVDAAWLGMDSPENLMMVTGVLRLHDEVDRPRLVDVIERRLLASYPKFSMRPLPSGSPFEQPVWTDDSDFDLDRHVVDAGEVSGDAGLADLVSGLLGRPLDMRHSPWQFHVVAVPATEGGRPTSAVVARLHHCIADGIALASVLMSLTDEDPDLPADAPDEPGAGHPRRPGLRSRLTEGSRDLAPVVGVDPLAPRSLRQAAEAVRFGWRVVSTGVGLLLANRDPRTRLSGRLGTAKVAAWSRPLDLAMTKRIAAALGVTVNDVLLAVTAGALRRHLTGHGETAHDLRVFVPVDLRRGAAVTPVLGNRFGIVFVTLPVSVTDPVERVRRVHERMNRRKAGAQAASTFAILAVVGALPSWAHRLAVRVLGAKSSAIVTNVPGPTRPVYLAGSRLTRISFWVPQAGSVGLGVSILSYAGEITIGVAADRNLLPDPGELVVAAEDELAELARVTFGVDDEAVVLEAAPFDSDLAAVLVAEVQDEYIRRYGGHDETPVDPTEFAAPNGTFLSHGSGRRRSAAPACAGTVTASSR